MTGVQTCALPICPENALYIGDSIYDIQCANNAGVDSGLVLWSNNVSNPIRCLLYTSRTTSGFEIDPSLSTTNWTITLPAEPLSLIHIYGTRSAVAAII